MRDYHLQFDSGTRYLGGHTPRLSRDETGCVGEMYMCIRNMRFLCACQSLFRASICTDKRLHAGSSVRRRDNILPASKGGKKQEKWQTGQTRLNEVMFQLYAAFISMVLAVTEQWD